METAATAVGIVSLISLFSNAVDCFEYVQLGRSFGHSFETKQLKLDIARLRLSRWGQSVGINGNLKDVQSLDQTSVSVVNRDKAEEILGQIEALFTKAQKRSTGYKNTARSEATNPLEHNPETDLRSVTSSLHRKMSQISINRQDRTRLTKKAKWVLYEERHFERLIEDITNLVNGLVELFPAAESSQRGLCRQEVSELGTNEDLPLLRDLANIVDSNLEAAVTEALKNSTAVSLIAKFVYSVQR